MWGWLIGMMLGSCVVAVGQGCVTWLVSLADAADEASGHAAVRLAAAPRRMQDRERRAGAPR